MSKFNESTCRICLLQSEDIHSFDRKLEVDTDNVRVSKMFSGCSGLEISVTDIPFKICGGCIVDLLQCYRFRRKCQESHATILLANSEKTGIIETNLQLLKEEDTKTEINTFQNMHFEYNDKLANNSEPRSVSNFSEILGRKKFKCTLCAGNVAFACSISQKAHRIIVHDKTGQCDKCSKKFRTHDGLRKHLRRHERTHTRNKMIQESSTKSFICDICGFYVAQHPKLVEHMRTHTGERPFKCTVCEYTGARKSSLVNHMRVHTGERPYKCRSCDKTFPTSGHRNEHEKTHRTERPYECPVCGKTFKVRCIWKDHMLIHQPELHKTCEYCGKTFSRDDNYKIHLRLHTGAQPYSCKICDKKFNQRHCLTSHYVNYHRGYSKSE